MGIYINKGNENFKRALNSEYVDKTGMIEIVNKTLNTERGYTCVTRCRRFGKSIALKMLCAYYDKSCDSRSLFDGLAAQSCPTFEQHLNKYPVIYLDLTEFITRYSHDAEIVKHIQRSIMTELREVYSQVPTKEDDDLMEFLIRVQQYTGEKFIMLIDEWDAICREFSDDTSVMDEYVNLLRRLFKGGNSDIVFAGVYMTGILPIKKYKTQSALNNFREYSVIDPGKLDKYFGFTPSEVEKLAAKSDVSVEELKAWYGGYAIGDTSMSNPHSVDEAIYREECSDFWKGTSSVYIIADYVKQDFDGISVVLDDLLNGGRYHIAAAKLDQDLSSISCKEHVLAILIHLGYLTYNVVSEECYVPNKEISIVLSNTLAIIRMASKARNTHV